MQQVGMIVACDLEGLIGYDNKLPWHNKTDLKRFKKLTMGGTLIMGRKTYDSLPVGKKTDLKLGGRLKHVLSFSANDKENTDDVKWFSNLTNALDACPEDKPVWIIGGESIYRKAIGCKTPDFIDITILNFSFALPEEDDIEDRADKIAKMPPVSFSYMIESEIQNEEDPLLWHRRYIRRPNLAKNS